jgi:hypothetical protein
MLFDSTKVGLIRVSILLLYCHVVSFLLRVHDQLVMIQISDQLTDMVDQHSKFFPFLLDDVSVLPQGR